MAQATATKNERQEETRHLDMATQPVKRLRMMLAAGEEVREIERVLGRTGDSVVSEVLREHKTFYEWDHYPKGDVFDGQSHSQYFYHAHPGGFRDTEHGHFHTFVRAKGMPRGMKPMRRKSRDKWPMGDDALTHVVAISMGLKGQPLRLFTTNRWVTGETWYRGDDVAKVIGRFVIDHARPSWPTNRWVGAMVRLFWPQIMLLLKARDQVIESWTSQNPGKDTLEDRRLEVVSQAEVAIEAQIAAVRAALDARNPERRLKCGRPPVPSLEVPQRPRNKNAASREAAPSDKVRRTRRVSRHTGCRDRRNTGCRRRMDCRPRTGCTDHRANPRRRSAGPLQIRPTEQERRRPPW